MYEIKVSVPRDTSQPENMKDYLEEKRLRLLACADAHAEFSKNRRQIDHLDGERNCILSLEGH